MDFDDDSVAPSPKDSQSCASTDVPLFQKKNKLFKKMEAIVSLCNESVTAFPFCPTFSSVEDTFGEFKSLAAQPMLAVFNDAGVGKDVAGLAALPFLQRHGIAACTVAHTSARIGEARSTLHDGVVSHCNAQALSLGIEPGQACAALIRQLQGSGG